MAEAIITQAQLDNDNSKQTKIRSKTLWLGCWLCSQPIWKPTACLKCGRMMVFSNFMLSQPSPHLSSERPPRLWPPLLLLVLVLCSPSTLTIFHVHLAVTIVFVSLSFSFLTKTKKVFLLFFCSGSRPSLERPLWLWPSLYFWFSLSSLMHCSVFTIFHVHLAVNLVFVSLSFSF